MPSRRVREQDWPARFSKTDWRPAIAEEVLKIEKKGEEYATSYSARIVERFLHTHRVKDPSRRCDRKVCFRTVCCIANSYRSDLSILYSRNPQDLQETNQQLSIDGREAKGGSD